MKVLKPIIKYLSLFFILYIVLISLTFVASFDDFYRDAMVKMSNNFYGDWSGEADIRVNAISEAETANNIQFQIFNKKEMEAAKQVARSSGQKKINISGILWSWNCTRIILIPLYLLIALVVVYPCSIKRKLQSLGLGLLLFFIYIYFFVGQLVHFKMHEDQEFFPDYQLSSFSASFKEYLIYSSIELNFIVAFLIWAVVTIRVKDFEKFVLK